MVAARCLGLHGLLAAVMMSSAVRTRRKESPKAEPPSVASSLAEQPAELACFLGSGYGVQKGCQYVPGVVNVESCDVAGRGEACYTDTNTESVRGYTRDVRTSFDYSTLTESITEAEGGGFGVSVSTGFSYMKRSQVSKKSTAFFIGASGITRTRSLNNPGALKLTAPAKQLLRANPSLFLQFYGSTFVHTITYGGSFLGSVTLNSKETSDDRDIGAFAAFSVNKGLFSVSGNSSFRNTVNEKTGKVQVFMDAEWRGGNVTQEYGSAEKLGNMFRSWDSTWRQNPAALTLVTRRWVDLVDVQEVVFALPPDQMMMFFTDTISPIIQRRISVENTQIMKVEFSVRQALTWIATASNANMRSCLQNLRDDIDRKRIAIDSLTDSQVLEIQGQFLKSDLSWFESETYQSRYTTCVGDADKICDGHSHFCFSWQTVQRDPRVDWCLRSPSCKGSSSSPSNDLLSSIASISQSRGQDHAGLRDELSNEFPGWEWIVARVNTNRRYAWAVRGFNFGADQTGNHLIVTGIHCPTPPACGRCQVTEDCVAENLRGGVDADSVGRAYSGCGGGHSGTRTIIGVRADGGWARAWSTRPDGQSCILRGSRHDNMYMITVAPGAARGMMVAKPAAADSNTSDVVVHVELSDFEVTPVPMDGSEVLPTDVGESSE